MKSKYGDRDTVGSTYLKAQSNSVEGLTLKDIGTEMVKSLVHDINATVESDPFDGMPFYMNIVEERDLQMKNAFKRRIFKTKYLPYPEDNTLVFYVEPKLNRVSYCWELPHHSEVRNIMNNFTDYDSDYIRRIVMWQSCDLTEFGYVKVSMDSAQVEGYDSKTLNRYRENYMTYCENLGMDEKSLDAEKKLGFFWIPNKNFTYKDLKKRQPTVSLIGV